MRALVQRVSGAAVTVGGEEVGRIGGGLLVFLGVTHGDDGEHAAWLARKCAGLRIFADAGGRMNLSVRQTGGEALVVSQFTLYGDGSRGNRPSFVRAADPGPAQELYDAFVAALRDELGEGKIRTGVFGAMMKVSLENDGPVTILLEYPHPTSDQGVAGGEGPG